MAKSPWRALLLGLTLLLSACGGGGGGSSTGGGTSTTFAVGGTLSGLASGQSITLNNKSTGESLTLSAIGNFVFTTTQASGANYAVTVSTQPAGQSCRVTDGLGVVGSANVTSIAVSCSSQYTVSATVTGLSGTVKLVDNSVDFQTVSSNITVAFAQKLADGQPYNVAVAAQPVGAVCQVGTNAAGVISGANVTVPVSCSVTPSAEYLYVATTNGGVGITPYKINLNTGALNTIGAGLVPTDQFPVALAADPAGPYLYTIGGNGGLAPTNDVTSLTITTGTGALSARTPVPAGNDPYGVAVRPDGKFVYVANNNDNDISIYSSSSGNLSFIGTAASGGTNPQGIVFNPAGTFLYVLNSGSDTVTTFAVDSNTGALTAVGSPVPTGVTPYGVQTSVTPGGTFLYVANYGSNSISAYSLGSNGLPSPIAGSPFAAGIKPFAVAINPAGTFAYVANEGDDTVSAYAIDPTYGTLTPVGSPVGAGSGSVPVGVTVDPSGQYLYVSNDLLNGTVVLFTIDQSSGALTLRDATAATGLGQPRPLVAVRP